MLLNLTDLSAEPLHRQMFRQIRARIVAGELDGEQGLPSIRKMAREQRVSVITVQRAYEDLERNGLIHSRRGKGFFVAPLAPRQRVKMAEERAIETLRRAVSEAVDEGLGPDEIRALVERLLEQPGRRKK